MRKRDGHFVNFCTLTPFFPPFHPSVSILVRPASLPAASHGLRGVSSGPETAYVLGLGAEGEAAQPRPHGAAANHAANPLFPLYGSALQDILRPA